MTTLIVGCGYLGKRVANRLLAQGERVIGTVRSPDRAARLLLDGIEPAILDVRDPASWALLPEASRVLYCVGFDRASGASMREVYVEGLRRGLKRWKGHVDRFVYASSTGVYGQTHGEWIDETSPVNPSHDSGVVVRDAEVAVLSEVGEAAVIIRYAGLYGPDRIVRRAAIEQGEVIAGDPDRWLNMIHIDDAASAAVLALSQPVLTTSPIYLASDDRPATRRDYYGLVAELLEAPKPRFQPPEPGTPEARRDESNKRVANRKIKEELGLFLRYTDISRGLPSALKISGES